MIDALDFLSATRSDVVSSEKRTQDKILALLRRITTLTERVETLESEVGRLRELVTPAVR